MGWALKLMYKIAVYVSMIYTAPYVMFLMRTDPLRGQVGGGWALEIETFLAPLKWHRAVRRVPFGAQKRYTSRATILQLSSLCQDKERKDEEDDDEDDDKGDDEERRRKKKTRTVFSRSQVSLMHYFSSFVQ
jgi:hypothetical protein